MLPIQVALALFAFAIIPRAAFAEEEQRSSNRWNFCPTIWCEAISKEDRAKVLSSFPYQKKVPYAENRSIIEIILDAQNKQKLEAKKQPTQTKVSDPPVKPGTKLSPLEAPAAQASKQFGNILVSYAPGALLFSEGNSAVLMTRITTKRKRNDLVIQVHETFLNSFHKPAIGTQRIQIPDEVVRVFLAPAKALIWSRVAESPQ
jgi:hypothetical protein